MPSGGIPEGPTPKRFLKEPSTGSQEDARMAPFINVEIKLSYPKEFLCVLSCLGADGVEIALFDPRDFARQID